MDDLEMLAALAPLGLRSTLDAPGLARFEGRALTTSADVTDLVDHFERSLFDGSIPPAGGTSGRPDRRSEVAASVAFQAVVAQIANPVLLAHRVLGIGLDVSLPEVRWRIDGWAVRYGLVELRRVEPASISEVVAALSSQLVEPWMIALSDVVPVPERTLRGNAAAAIWTAVRALHVCRPLDPEVLRRSAVAVLGPLEVDNQAGFTRDTCCLIHLAGLAPCSECPLEGPDGLESNRGDVSGRST